MLYFIYRNILLILMRSSILVGGQAVIEGVMMRVPGAYATAVRRANGEIIFDYHPFSSLTTQKSILSFHPLAHLLINIKILNKEEINLKP